MCHVEISMDTQQHSDHGQLVPGNRVRAAVLVLTMLLLLLAWTFWRSACLSQGLWREIARGPGTIVDFAHVAPFSWERVYFFPPYSSHEHIERSLGFHWDGVRQTTIDSSDTVNLVVFVQYGR